LEKAMTWWLVPSIIGVMMAGVLTGLLVSKVILKMKKDNSVLFQKNNIPSLPVISEPTENTPVTSQINTDFEVKTQPVISVDEKVETYLNLINSHPQVKNNISTKKSGALIELENNLSLASRPVTNNLVNFHTEIWNTKRSEFNILPAEILEELTEAYVDMLLANNIAWLVTELGRSSQDLLDSYSKLSNKIADRLQRILPTVREAFK
jgi:hypothetical protein